MRNQQGYGTSSSDSQSFETLRKAVERQGGRKRSAVRGLSRAGFGNGDQKLSCVAAKFLQISVMLS